jgi:hypothetical protein
MTNLDAFSFSPGEEGEFAGGRSGECSLGCGEVFVAIVAGRVQMLFSISAINRVEEAAQDAALEMPWKAWELAALSS